MTEATMIEALVGLAAILGAFSIPIVAILTRHRQKMLELQLRLRQHQDTNLRETVEQLRAEVQSLRDTALQYDLSFDTALQRLEARVTQLERRSRSVAEEPIVPLTRNE
ncbi:MAG: hypothetical protein RMJ43_12840 [Chloroherpetonaceae bacterium]|nr:hypothetical protein [Chthonomonadaceae bacterium]MDW8208716.1 hypothetical protein [Chloroherpetonaceae bacterium]